MSPPFELHRLPIKAPIIQTVLMPHVVLTHRTYPTTGPRLSRSTDVPAVAHGSQNRKEYTATDYGYVLRQEQTTAGILVQYSQEQVSLAFSANILQTLIDEFPVPLGLMSCIDS